LPLRGIIAELPVVELLAMANWPVTAPAAVGASCTLIEAVWPGFNETGNERGTKAKPLPVTVAPLTVTVPVPVDASVSVRVVTTLTGTSPKATLAALTPRVAVCAVDTAETLNVNCALDVFLCTSAAVVVATAALSLDMATLRPPSGAGPFKVSVHRSVPAPPIEELAQVNPVSTGSPVPLSGMVAVPLLEDVLEMLS
jgi:hypothetical protein